MTKQIEFKALDWDKYSQEIERTGIVTLENKCDVTDENGQFSDEAFIKDITEFLEAYRVASKGRLLKAEGGTIFGKRKVLLFPVFKGEVITHVEANKNAPRNLCEDYQFTSCSDNYLRFASKSTEFYVDMHELSCANGGK